MTDVFVVDINVDKAAQRVLVVVEMTALLGMQRRQTIQSFTGGGRFHLDAGIAAGKLTQRRGNIYRD